MAAASRILARTRERAGAYRVFILRRIVISRALSRRKEPGIIEPVPYRPDSRYTPLRVALDLYEPDRARRLLYARV